MKIGAILSPAWDWPAVLDAAVAADEAGLDAVGLWDHYHSAQPDWAYVSGFSALGAIAAVTRRIRIVPLVLNSLHHELGVLAKESSMLAIGSGGRFELGIGAGDWPESFRAWGRPFPPAAERLAMLEEKVSALRRLWSGGPVSIDGVHVRLDGAICAPVPAEPPRAVVGVGGSVRMLEAALRFADEVNVYDSEPFVRRAVERAAAAPARRTVSVFVDWSWDRWPEDPAGRVAPLAELGADRLFVSIGAVNMRERVAALAAFAGVTAG